MNTSGIEKIHADEFGWLPVVRQTFDYLTVRHPTYGEFVLRTKGLYHGGTGFEPADHRAMIQRMLVLQLHIP